MEKIMTRCQKKCQVRWPLINADEKSVIWKARCVKERDNMIANYPKSWTQKAHIRKYGLKEWNFYSISYWESMEKIMILYQEKW